MSFQWIGFIFNTIVLLFFFFWVSLSNRLIAKEKRWVSLPLFVIVLFVVILLIGYVFYPSFFSYVKYLGFFFDWLTITDKNIQAYFIYAISFVLIYFFIELIAGIILKFIKIPVPWYIQMYDNSNKLYLKPKYEICNYYFKDLFWIFLFATLVYSLIGFDVTLVVLDIFTAYAFIIRELFPVPVEDYEEIKLLNDSDEDLDPEPFKNSENFERFLSYVLGEFDKDKKVNSVDKMRGINQDEK